MKIFHSNNFENLNWIVIKSGTAQVEDLLEHPTVYIRFK